MSDSLPIVFVPGLFCTARLFADQIGPLWKFGSITIADHSRDDTMAAMAQRILAASPPRFALVGLSMGGYVAFEIWRQASDRVAKLALLDTTARPDTPEQTKVRNDQIAQAEAGKFAAIVDKALPMLIHRQGDQGLRAVVKQMAADTGEDAFIRQQRAIVGRADSRPDLAKILCPTLVLVGAEDKLIPPDRSREMADGIAGAKMVTVDACGHISSLEQPAKVTEALVDWMSN
ncbi:MAG TPA: alpha/beta fold hydrolase [Steroidobacteraceae bacterium]|nr:alpha/beta fold hydrolase [Steroidobacteraceae bacterium]